MIKRNSKGQFIKGQNLGNQFAKNNKPNKTSFKTGHITWCKDTKGIVKPNSGSFKKGDIAWNKNTKGIMPIPWNKDKILPPLSETHKNKLSEAHKGEKNYNWKGGRVKHSSGYVLLYLPDHPYCNKTKRFFEHRYMAECCLGRFLNPEEQIHHINGIRNDNRPENLYLFSSNSEHIKFHCNPYPLKSNLI